MAATMGLWGIFPEMFKHWYKLLCQKFRKTHGLGAQELFPHTQCDKHMDLTSRTCISKERGWGRNRKELSILINPYG